MRAAERASEPLGPTFMQHALVAGAVVGGPCARVGVYVVRRGLAFIKARRLGRTPLLFGRR